MEERSEIRAEEGSLGSYLEVFLRRIWLLIGVFFATTVLIFVLGALARPVYQSSLTLLISGEKTSQYLFSPTQWLFPRGPNLANHLELLRSRTIAQMAYDTLPDEIKQELARFYGPYPVGSMMGSVSARTIKDADMIRLSVTGPTPRLSQAIASAYAAAYQKWTLEQNRADIRAVREFIAAQLQVASPRLDSVERALESYKAATGKVDLSTQASALINRQSQVLAMAQQTKIELEGAKKELALLKSSLDSTRAGSIENPQGMPLVGALSDELTRLETERTNLLLQGYDSTSPRVQMLTGRINETKQRLATGLLTATSFQEVPAALNRITQLVPEIACLEAKLITIQRAIAGYESELARLPTEERQLARLTRDVEVARQINSLLQTKFEEARLQEAGRLSEVSLVDPPGLGGKIKPNHRQNAMLAILFGIVLAVGTTFLVDRLDTRVRDPEDLERHGWTVLGAIQRINPHSPEAKPITLEKPKATVSEDFRTLRTNLQFLGVDKPLRYIVVTSSSPNEGKTTVAANLAVVLAQAGKKTILMACDFRHPYLHRLFGQKRKPGITDVLLLGCPLEQAIYQVETGKREEGALPLDILFAGTTPPSPIDFITSETFLSFVRQLSGAYEYVVIDTPPVLVANDAAVLAAELDGAILVARMGQSDSNAIAETYKIFHMAQARLLGIVANGVQARRRYGYYRYKYRYYYRYYHYRYPPPEAASDSEKQT